MHEGTQAAVNLGWPSLKDEAWRYSSSEILSELKISPAAAATEIVPFEITSEVKELIQQSDFALVFYNGSFMPHCSKVAAEKIKVLPLSQIAEEEKNIVSSLQSNANLKTLGDLNTAQFTNGAFVHFPDESLGDKKVSIIQLYGNQRALSRQNPFTVYPRNRFSFGVHARAEILEVHLAVNNISFLINSRTQYDLAPQSRVNIVQCGWLGDEGRWINDTQARLSNHSRLNYFNLHLTPKYARNDLLFQLCGEGAELGAYSIVRTTKNHRSDTNSFIEHLVGNTRSEQITRNILLEDSRNAFTGRLKIHQDAQKSDASQYCHNLLLSANAEANCRPQLEVEADDVKAAHGATSGSISDEDIFYLRSRAISEGDAVKMLAHGFERKLIDKIESPFLREKVEIILARAQP